MKRALLLFMVALILPSCAKNSSQPSYNEGINAPRAGSIFLPAGLLIENNDYIQRAQNSDFILIGEQHDSAADHAMQAFLIAQLAASGQRFSVGLEMVSATSQTVLDAFNEGRISLAELPEAIQWESIWGFDFAFYEPIFAVAKRYSLPVYGININKETLAVIRDQGVAALNISQRAELPEAIALPPEKQQAFLRSIFFMHGKKPARQTAEKRKRPQTASSSVKKLTSPLGAPSLERFMRVQSIWDSTMAQNAYDIQKKTGTPMVILAGGAHVEHGYGIAYRLSLLAPESTRLLIMPAKTTQLTPYTRNAADIFFLSPPQERSTRRPFLGIGFEIQQDQLVVTSVMPSLLADRAGIKKGDVLKSINNFSIKTPEDLHTSVAKVMRINGTKKEITFLIVRSNTKKELLITIP